MIAQVQMNLHQKIVQIVAHCQFLHLVSTKKRKSKLLKNLRKNDFNNVYDEFLEKIKVQPKGSSSLLPWKKIYCSEQNLHHPCSQGICKFLSLH